MAVRRQPLAVIQDENAEINRGLFAGKTNMAKSGGLKVQQTDLSDRKPLSNSTNKLKPLPNLGAATPSALRNESARAGVENAGNSKGAFSVMVDPELLGKSGVKGRTVSRTPLGNITNVESSMQKGEPVKEKKAHSKNVKMGPNPSYEVTEEMKQKADIWAREGIERSHFTGKDMEAHREKMAEEEVNRLVAQALSYRSEIPCWLPGALVEQPTEIKDCLELDPEVELVEDLFAKGSSSFHGMEQQDFDYDESFYECLEILKTADLPVVIDECVW